jgi:hypothetical protein
MAGSAKEGYLSFMDVQLPVSLTGLTIKTVNHRHSSTLHV